MSHRVENSTQRRSFISLKCIGLSRIEQVQCCIDSYYGERWFHESVVVLYIGRFSVYGRWIGMLIVIVLVGVFVFVL